MTGTTFAEALSLPECQPVPTMDVTLWPCGFAVTTAMSRHTGADWLAVRKIREAHQLHHRAKHETAQTHWGFLISERFVSGDSTFHVQCGHS